MIRTLSFTAMFVGFLLMETTVLAAKRYAKPSPSGTGDCLSWTNACTLASALTLSASGDKVWVKAGTFPPFDLKDGVQIIGGFAGIETVASQSNPVTNVTIVEGGGAGRCINSENHSSQTVLRGFSIRSGHDSDEQGGGGLRLKGSSALIVQCVFENNTATYLGGAVAIRDGGSPQFINCLFRNNGAVARADAPHDGGAVFLDGATASFVNCLFHNNKAGRGGAFAMEPMGSATFTNCTLANNQATWRKGGAIFDPSESVKLRNCILWGNTRVEGDPPQTPQTISDQIYGPGTGPEVLNSDVQGGWTGAGNIDADPLFHDPDSGSYGIALNSPCRDVGSNGLLPPDAADLDWDDNFGETLPKDLSRKKRIHDFTVDIGAYEDQTVGQ